jgi:integrase
MDNLFATPSKANSFLSAMQALSKWARVRNHIEQSLIEGVEGYAKDTGHKPWTPEQIKAAHDQLTGTVRRGILLMLYTGQRGSDVVRLGPTDVVRLDDGNSGFSLRQKKTGRYVVCPILDELAAEMDTWKRRPGPYLLQANGKPYSRKLLWKHFDEARENIPELGDVTMHGLRATAVVRLRRLGLSAPLICDAIGMSLPMVQRYCRFADQEENARAVLTSLRKNAK